jgi:hypothetical protein
MLIRSLFLFLREGMRVRMNIARCEMRRVKNRDEMRLTAGGSAGANVVSAGVHG